jgi:hypothetical protein
MPGAPLPGSDRARVRILATDGFHVAHDDSDGTFTVEGSAPLVHIGSPKDGSRWRPSSPPILSGLAHDLEDGMLGGQSLSWHSDLDGELGTGDEILIGRGGLSQGLHHITLSATDSDGMTAQSTARVLVREGLAFLPLVVR